MLQLRLDFINMLYAVSLTSGVARWRVRFGRPSVLAHCDVVVCMCFDHDSYEYIVMPRKACDSTWEIGWFVIV